MQLYTTIGFFNVIRTGSSDALTVQSDRRANLDNLRQQFIPGLSPATTYEHADYPYHALISPEEFGAGLARMGKAIDFRDGLRMSGYEPLRAFDYKQFVILLVDYEKVHLRAFKRAWQDQFRILTANNPDTGLSLLKHHKNEIGVLITNCRLPKHDGLWLLKEARRIKPHLVRIYFGATQTTDALQEACRIGIHRYIPLPYDAQELEETLRVALRQYSLFSALDPVTYVDTIRKRRLEKTPAKTVPN
jgi:CheY-like chemotaxis protein